MADSGTYDQATIDRRRKIAEQMLTGAGSRPVRHWAEGLANLGDAFVGGRLYKKSDDEAKEVRKQDLAAMMGVLGGTPASPTAAPAAPAAIPAPAQPPAPTSPGERLPRGLRNNNPLNIEAGPFTQGQPGFQGSDGRFARFENQQQGIDAASKLLDIYRDKHGLNSVGGIVGRWAPAGENDTRGYAASVAGRLGITPDQPLTPAQRIPLIMAMGQFENGRPIGPNNAPQVIGQDGVPERPNAKGAYGPDAVMLSQDQADPAALPPNATLTAGGPSPVAQSMSPTAGAPAPQPASQPAAVTPRPQSFGGIPDKRKADIARLLATTPGSPAHTMGMAILSKSVAGEKEDVVPMTPEQRKVWQVPEGMSAGIDRNSGKPVFSPPQTNIALNTTQKGQEVMATKTAEDFQNVNIAGRDAVKRSAVWDEMEKAAKGFTPGATANIKLEAKRYLKDIGIIKGEDVPDAEVFKQMQQQIAVHAQPKGQGAVSNSERELFAKAIPNITMSPEGLSRAIQMSRKLDEYDRKVAQIYRDSARKNQGVANGIDVNDEIEKLGSPLTTADMAFLKTGNAATGSTTPAADTAAPGKVRKFNSATGMIE